MTVDSVVEPYAVRAVMRTLDILELVEKSSAPVTLNTVVSVTGLPKTSAFRYLATLERRGYIERSAHGAYELSHAYTPVPIRDLERFARAAQPTLAELRDRFEATVSLAVLYRHHVSYLATAWPSHSTALEMRSRFRTMVHCTASGKALAANLPEDRTRVILASAGMPRFTKRTIIDPDQFIHELSRVRRAGYAVNDRENDEVNYSIARMLTTRAVPLAITLSTPADLLPVSRIEEAIAAFDEFDLTFGQEREAPTAGPAYSQSGRV